ncbi:MAG: fibrobacter succinogenes major paralogous domain-containing protein [Bacteroidales bacterium]
MKNFLLKIVQIALVLFVFQNIISKLIAQDNLKVTDIDGNIYDIVSIGNQTWMKQNLKVTHYCNGDNIPNIIENETWYNLSTGAYCCYNNDESYSIIYGKLYNFYTVTDSRNLCPNGWHVPNNAEWNTLTTYLGGDNIAGGKLKEIGFTHWIRPNTSATNKTGFTALPAGNRYNGAIFYNMGEGGYWWSTTVNDEEESAWNFMLSNDYGGIYSGGEFNKKYGFSVRCMKD